MRKQCYSLLLAVGIAAALTGCQTGAKTTDAATETSSMTMAKTETATTFGEAFEAPEVIPAASLLTSFNEDQLADTVATTLSGTVNEVCQVKGCWMTVAASDTEEMMVKFKNYGFFMPKDISGREVVMHGKAYYQVTPVDELRHYAEDAGKSAEEIAKITEPKKELRFLADGVRLMK